MTAQDQPRVVGARPDRSGAWTPQARRVLRERYLARGEQQLETPEEMCWRVAATIAAAEASWGKTAEEQHRLATRYYELMVDGLFLPNSPTLMNAGRATKLQYSACYVLPVGDSMEEIFDAVKAAAVVHQSGGGTGFAFSRLRPKNSLVASTGGRSSGPVSFLRVFDGATEAVKQGGARRGANMGVLRVDHPDILEFVECKLDGSITNFNLSVAITDRFMEALDRGEEYELVAPHTGQVTGRLPAREVFDRIVRSAWQSGDPGLVFLDRINASRANPTPAVGLIEATNPCIAGDALVATDRGLLRMDALVLEQQARGVSVRVDERLLPAAATLREGTSGAALAAGPAFPYLPLSAAFCTGLRETVTIRTRSGLELTCTPDHRLMTGRGWIPASELILEVDRVFTHVDAGRLRRGSSTDVVVAREPAGVRRVYDFTEPETHSAIVNGIVVHNCGEQPLLPMEACNLGSIDVSKLVTKDAGGSWSVDWSRLEHVVRSSVRFLDDVIECNPYPLSEIDAMVKANRRIGLGIMGWADLLFRLGIPYDSDEALALADRLMAALETAGHDESAKLAEERGAFPNFARSIYRDGRPLRNATVTTIAPTGTISIIAGCSSGIEPAFAISFTHQVGERVLPFYNRVFEEVARERGFWSEELMAEVARRGTVRGLPGVPEDVQRVFVTAHEVPYEWHVRHQAAFQKWTDNGVSKTINLPHDATVEDVRRAYLQAWQLGCLGITVFRDGSKTGVLRVGAATEVNGVVDRAVDAAETHGEPETAAPAPPPKRPVLEPRPASLPGTTHRVQTPLGTAYVVVNEDREGEPFEVFISVGKAGTDTMAVAEAIGRLVSLALRMPSSVPPRARLTEIVEQLSGIGGARPLGFGSERVLSLPDGIAHALARHLGSEAVRGAGDICPDCGAAALVREEGCSKCHACGFSEC